MSSVRFKLFITFNKLDKNKGKLRSLSEILFTLSSMTKAAKKICRLIFSILIQKDSNILKPVLNDITGKDDKW